MIRSNKAVLSNYPNSQKNQEVKKIMSLPKGTTVQIEKIYQESLIAIIEETEEKIFLNPELVSSEIRKEGIWLRWNGKKFILAMCMNT
jgi:hypothetical protein